MTDFALLFLLVCLAVGAGIAWFRILAVVVADAEERKAVDRWWKDRQANIDASFDAARRRLHDNRSLKDDSPRDAAKGERNA